MSTQYRLVVGKDCQWRLLSRPRFVRACSATDFLFYFVEFNKSVRDSVGERVRSISKVERGFRGTRKVEKHWFMASLLKLKKTY
jgi:hypothetical protein